ncbi:uncharacterized protein LOC126092844 [Schistocerca cancellata]|uniref:uncharacterized protein LOC126092844 n=1 Tax=Schistocerca cancellata TaxID=274614 RepID=UPI002119654E|nr:uncharacterized protein LOC126092844 [Schistocerca cancellata]
MQLALHRFDTSFLLEAPTLKPADIPEILWFEEETELIRSCGALSSALGLQKSFSTSDISQLPSPQGTAAARCAVSELALWGDATHARLEPASRSCSTWVAVGDVASTSQLPSPHGAPPPPVPAFTAADLIRSVNKKVAGRSMESPACRPGLVPAEQRTQSRGPPSRPRPPRSLSPHPTAAENQE